MGDVTCGRIAGSSLCLSLSNPVGCGVRVNVPMYKIQPYIVLIFPVLIVVLHLLLQLNCCMGNTIDREENTFKQYYFSTSDDEVNESPYAFTGVKRPKESTDSLLDEFFDAEPKKKKTKLHSSTVGRGTMDGMTYISTNQDDGLNATHLIKIEITDLKKIKNVDPTEHWKHADVRVKYYINKQQQPNQQRIRGIIYDITKEITASSDCKKYTFKH